MPMTATALYRGAAATGSTTLYTVPAATTTIVTNIVVTNTAASAATFTITLDGVAIMSGATLAANGVAFFDMKQVLATGKIIAGLASATTVNFNISGVQQT